MNAALASTVFSPLKDIQEMWTSHLCGGELLRNRESSLVDSFLASRGRLTAVVTQKNKARLRDFCMFL